MKHDKKNCGDDCQCGQGKCDESASAQPKTELEVKLSEAEAKAAENWELYLRSRAEFENYQKRVQRDLAFHVRCGKGDLVKGMLPVIDDFERALAAEAEASPFRQGVEMIMRKLLEVLARDGVKPIEALGAPFDPRLHEAVATRAQEGVADHTIVEELRRGYTYDEDVIRPTLAVVAVTAQQ